MVALAAELLAGQPDHLLSGVQIVGKILLLRDLHPTRQRPEQGQLRLRDGAEPHRPLRVADQALPQSGGDILPQGQVVVEISVLTGEGGVQHAVLHLPRHVEVVPPHEHPAYGEVASICGDEAEIWGDHRNIIDGHFLKRHMVSLAFWPLRRGKIPNIIPDPAAGIKGKLLSCLRLILLSLQGRFANVSYFVSGQWLFLFASGG